MCKSWVRHHRGKSEGHGSCLGKVLLPSLPTKSQSKNGYPFPPSPAGGVSGSGGVCCAARAGPAGSPLGPAGDSFGWGGGSGRTPRREGSGGRVGSRGGDCLLPVGGSSPWSSGYLPWGEGPGLPSAAGRCDRLRVPNRRKGRGRVPHSPWTGLPGPGPGPGPPVPPPVEWGVQGGSVSWPDRVRPTSRSPQPPPNSVAFGSRLFGPPFPRPPPLNTHS